MKLKQRKLKDDDVWNLVYSCFVSLRNDIIQTRPKYSSQSWIKFHWRWGVLILYEFFEPRSPDFPHEVYAKFDLDEMAESESLSEFRLGKGTLSRRQKFWTFRKAYDVSKDRFVVEERGFVCCLGGYHIFADIETWFSDSRSQSLYSAWLRTSWSITYMLSMVDGV